MIFGINTTSDISKLFYIISQAVRRVKFEAIDRFADKAAILISIVSMGCSGGK